MNNRQPYLTKAGNVLSGEELEKLAVEAERGYDITELTQRRRRPRRRPVPAGYEECSRASDGS